MFLAFHHSILGPYFGDDEGILQWPHNPLNNTPSALEVTFNDKMMEITEKFTKGKIQGLSWLDFPGIGNSIGAKYLVLFSSQSLKTREKYISFAQLVLLICIFFLGSVFTFPFLNDKIHNYVIFFDIIVNFNVQN